MITYETGNLSFDHQIEIEGDVRGQTPVRVEVVPRALRLVMPTDG